MAGISREEFEQWGFRWPVETDVRLSDGRNATIQPWAYLASREALATTDRMRKFLRLYNISFSDGEHRGDVYEIEVERLLGENPDATDARLSG